MTNQVDVTETDTKSLSDEEQYEAEWGKDDDSDQVVDLATSEDADSEKDREEDGDQGKAEDAGTATPETVNAGTGDTTPDGTDNPKADGDGGDIWADAPEELRSAYLKAQNERDSAVGRANSFRDEKARLEKEFEAAQLRLSEATREKGVYEQEHPELFDEVLKVVESRTPQPADTSENAGEELDEAAKAVLKVHPDAYNLMQTDAWSDFASSASPELQAKLNSDDPYEFIDYVNEFKIEQRLAAARSETPTTPDDDTPPPPPPGTGSRPGNPSPQSDDDGYDEEWAKED